MQNNFRFRSWNILNKDFIYWGLFDQDPRGEITFGTSDPQQSTGLFDKEEKEIYVGDYIFCIDDMEFYEVLFYKGMYVIKIVDGDYSPLYDYTFDSIVVGNVFSTTIDILKKSLG
jgi:hypothetical protein